MTDAPSRRPRPSSADDSPAGAALLPERPRWCRSCLQTTTYLVLADAETCAVCCARLERVNPVSP